MRLAENLYNKNLNDEIKNLKRNKSFRPGLVTALNILFSSETLDKRQFLDLNEMRIHGGVTIENFVIW